MKPGGLSQRPSTARTPASIASINAAGRRPVRSTSHERSINSNPSGTATESRSSPVTFAGNRTLLANPARFAFDVNGTTWACQTSTPSTSADETTTHGRRLSRSTQCTSPRATTARFGPSAYRPLQRRSGVADVPCHPHSDQPTRRPPAIARKTALPRLLHAA